MSATFLCSPAPLLIISVLKQGAAHCRNNLKTMRVEAMCFSFHTIRHLWVLQNYYHLALAQRSFNSFSTVCDFKTIYEYVHTCSRRITFILINNYIHTIFVFSHNSMSLFEVCHKVRVCTVHAGDSGCVHSLTNKIYCYRILMLLLVDAGDSKGRLTKVMLTVM